MEEGLGAGDGSHPSLNLTPEEKRVYGQLFKEADPDGFGAVSGDVAVKFFERTNLPADVLGQIWQIADTENRGFLTPSGFGVVLRLIGHAQAGRPPSASLAPSPAPVPRFNNQPEQQLPPSIAAQQAVAPVSPSQAGGPPVRVPALTPEKVVEYSGLFEKSGAENGILPGLVAKQIFERARLPNDVLGRIWGLADTQAQGSLDVTGFIIAMHMLASYKSGAMRGVPNTLPAGLYEAASRRPPPRMNVAQRPGSASGMQPQFSGYGNMPPQSPQSRGRVGTPLSSQSTGEPWLIGLADKARFDQIFSTVDVTNSGFISGEQAVEFFGNARLSEEALAQIWDLADINSDGRLNRDEFAVAMYLIRQQRGTRDRRGNLPPQLPPALVPPSMRKQQQPASQATAPDFDAAPVTKPRSAADDLFGLDVMSDPPVPPMAAQQVAQSTGGTDAGPFANPKPPQASSSPSPQSSFKPFMPSSSFGQSLMPQPSGSPGPGQKRAIPTAEADLLGGDDTEQSSKLTNDSAELGNLSNQVVSLSKQMTDLQTTRGQTEQELNQTSQQKRAFQERLAQLRSAYESEAQQVKALQEQLTASRSDTKRIQQDMAMLEGTHADLQTQRQQLSTALQADQQENAALKERIRQTNAENDQIKPQLEKLKSEARQQKGLVAINKKQLATNEAERDRIRAEIASAQQEIDAAAKEAEETSRQVAASQKEVEAARSISAPSSRSPPPTAAAATSVGAAAVAATATAATIPAVASPTPSTSSNPFFRRQNSDTVFSPPMGSNIQSPEPDSDRNAAFDSIFGPSYGSSTAAPATSFGRDMHDHLEGHETPVVVEPPPPPPADQIKSSALPMRQPLTREDSISSSVRVAPPASRLSPAETPRASSPDTPTDSPVSHRADDPFSAAAPDEEQESVRQTLPRGDTSEKISGIPGAFPDDGSRSVTPAQASSPTPVAALGVGAVAGLAAGAGVASVATHQDHQDQDDSNITPLAAPPKDTNFDDFFGGPAHQRTTSEQAADFDAAFASMDKSGDTIQQPKPQSNNQEFPAIQELAGDDSSSDDEEPSKGFDDDFNSPPPPPAKDTPAAGKQVQAPLPVPDRLQPRPPLESASTGSSLPGFDPQTSPPTYKEAVPEDNPNHFPLEYKGLLPEREDPTGPSAPTEAGPASGPSQLTNSPPYGPEVGPPRRMSLNQATEATPIKSSAFDFDSAFEGMGAAPVADDSESDYGDEPGTNKAQGLEFDPSFDSPAPSSRVATATSMDPSSSVHDAVTNTAPVTNGTSTIENAPRSTDFYSFNDSQSVPVAAQSQPPPPASHGASDSISHDWDALFAPLNKNQAADPTAVTDENNLNLTKTQTTEIAPGTTALTTAQPVDGSSGQPSPPISSAAAGAPVLASPVDSNKLNPPQRPQPGRALSEGTEHDDPILKRLTAMGWSRTESLAALEKYDYNIDKAADYLTFRS